KPTFWQENDSTYGSSRSRPLTMQTLKVRMIEKEEVYKDVARIPEKYRRDKRNALIPEGRICKITVNGRSRLLSVRGRLHEDEGHCFDGRGCERCPSGESQFGIQFPFERSRLVGSIPLGLACFRSSLSRRRTTRTHFSAF